MIPSLIENFNLNCTEEEFMSYMESIDTTETEAELLALEPSIFRFDEEYNDVLIENPAGWEVYYTIEIWGRVFLQNIVPFVEWLNPITEENVQNTIFLHKTELIAEYLSGLRLQLTIEHFTPSTI